MATKTPQISILDQLKNDPKYSTRRSVDWFKQKIQQLGGNAPGAKTQLLKETKHLQTNMVIPGAMHFFSYDPKFKETLPFYDKFPLALVFSIEDNLFRGINFHYLPYVIRGKLYDKLIQIAGENPSQPDRVRRLNWKLLGNVSKFPEVQPAVKSYLYSHVQSRFIKVPIEDWKGAIFLPVDSFAKKSQSFVARNSGQIIRRYV